MDESCNAEGGGKQFMISLYKYNRYFSHSIVPKHRQATSTDFSWKQQNSSTLQNILGCVGFIERYYTTVLCG